MPDGRVLIAFDDGPLEPSPTWTRIDDTANLVAEIEIHRGRQTELDQTDTSTATVRLNDTQGIFDPANTSSPYFGKIDGKQIMLQLRNPVTDEWVPQFRGFIDDYGFDLHPSQVVSNIQVECVDLFDFLAGVEMIPGPFGDATSGGQIVYQAIDVQTRITQLLSDAQLDADRFVVFTGNIDVQKVGYDPGDSILAAVRDAADAEFPTISNVYTDKLGRVCFHGREAKFDPDTVAAGAGAGQWNFTRWKAGDGAAIAFDSANAQIRPPVQWSRSRRRILNAFLITPRGIPQQTIPDLILADDGGGGSIEQFGYRSYSATDLIVARGTTTGNNCNDECLYYSTLLLDHYKQPYTSIEALTFKAMLPDDPRAASTWALICGVDISDIVNLSVGYPGGFGIGGLDYFVEGSDMTIEPAAGDAYDMVTLSLNVSQRLFVMPT